MTTTNAPQVTLRAHIHGIVAACKTLEELRAVCEIARGFPGGRGYQLLVRLAHAKAKIWSTAP